MVVWKDPAVLAKCVSLFANLSHITSGAYIVEVLRTSVYDYEIVTRKRSWTWTMLLYFIAKWIMLFCCISLLLVLDIDYPINCQALYTFAELAGNVSIGAASTLLMIRTFAIWKRSWWVIIPLTLLSLGQWAILFHGIAIKSVFDPDMKICTLVSTGDKRNLWLNLQYLYTMGFDLMVLILSTVGLLLTPGRTTLWRLLFRDGIVYFVIAFSANLCVAVFLLLDLNPVMNVMFSLPAACITASAATRSFIRLSTHISSNPHVHSPPVPCGPGSCHAGATPMVTWARTTMNVEAGTVKLPNGAEVSDDFLPNSQKYASGDGAPL